jgi:hypothetical protein
MAKRINAFERLMRSIQLDNFQQIYNNNVDNDDPDQEITEIINEEDEKSLMPTEEAEVDQAINQRLIYNFFTKLNIDQ